MIKRLELLEDVLAIDKASILLVHGALKPSAIVIISKPIANRDELRQTSHELTGILSELNLSFSISTLTMDTTSIVRVFIASDQPTASLLQTLFDSKERDDARIGRMLGYPETAIEAYRNKNLLPLSSHPSYTEDVSPTNMYLLNHRLSNQYWEEEVKYLEEWGMYLENVSPVIYRDCTVTQ